MNLVCVTLRVTLKLKFSNALKNKAFRRLFDSRRGGQSDPGLYLGTSLQRPSNGDSGMLCPGKRMDRVFHGLGLKMPLLIGFRLDLTRAVSAAKIRLYLHLLCCKGAIYGHWANA